MLEPTSRLSGFDMAEPVRRYDMGPVTAGRSVSSVQQTLHRGSGWARELDPAAVFSRWSGTWLALLWLSRCSRHAPVVATSKGRQRLPAQQANCPRRQRPCRPPRGRLSAPRIPVQRRRNQVPHSHRAGQHRSRLTLKNRHRRHRRRRIPRGHQSARRPPRPGPRQ